MYSIDWVAVAHDLIREDEPFWDSSIAALRRLYVAALLRRFNETVALDYVTPFRVLGRHE